jgi:uncharacterized protein with HEPN domain
VIAVEGRTKDQLSGDGTLRYAIAQQLTVVGEVAARINSELVRRYALVP